MPVYTYHCDHCDHEFEKYQSFTEDSLSLCPVCRHESLRKIYSPALVVFKGSGFYVTDTKSHSPTMSSGSKETGNGDTPAGEKKADAKSSSEGESKPEKKTKKEKK
jgi:putative FmdB family regulatory protein